MVMHEFKICLAEWQSRKHSHIQGGRTMIERRRYVRVPFFCPLHLTVLPRGPTLPANSFDLGLGGVGLCADIFLERGQEVLLRFHINHHGQNVIDEEIFGRVAYSRADEDGNRIGVEFLELLRDSTYPQLSQALNKELQGKNEY